jgi:hypothetical protein
VRAHSWLRHEHVDQIVSGPGFGLAAAQLAFLLLSVCVVMWVVLMVRAVRERRWLWRSIITPVVVIPSVALVRDNAGFAYLPAGTAAVPDHGGTFESPHYHRLGGSWYGWTASW